MKTSHRRIIDGPLSMDPKLLLDTIEQDPDAFLTGRRNDDLVNWFLARRMYELQCPGDPKEWSVDHYIEEFEDIELNGDQLRALETWDFMSPARKIEQLYNHYGSIDHLKGLAYYWLPMDYQPLVINTDPML